VKDVASEICEQCHRFTRQDTNTSVIAGVCQRVPIPTTKKGRYVIGVDLASDSSTIIGWLDEDGTWFAWYDWVKDCPYVLEHVISRGA